MNTNSKFMAGFKKTYVGRLARFFYHLTKISEILKRVEILEDDVIVLKDNMRFFSDKAMSANNQIDKLRSLGIDLFEAPTSNLLDKKTNSQAGEDSILAHVAIMLSIPFYECTYLDLGANHAKEMSNTYFFYSQGARGVLVEANPELIPELRIVRHRDVVLNYCVDSVSDKIVDFYVLNGDALSTPNKDDVESRLKENKNLQLKEAIPIKTITVNRILEQHFKKAPIILSIDIEGKELDILESIDLTKWRPLLIVCEMIPYSPNLVVGEKNQEILDFMKVNGYEEYAFTGINSIFIDKNRIPKKS